jgi:hypothetical protein
MYMHAYKYIFLLAISFLLVICESIHNRLFAYNIKFEVQYTYTLCVVYSYRNRFEVQGRNCEQINLVSTRDVASYWEKL